MNTVRELRASDLEREQIVARLRGAFEEGRLAMDEYVTRMEAACQARTYGELASLCDDLPSANIPAAGQPAAGRPAVKTTMGMFATLPAVLRVLWTTWLAIVAVNVVVWATVSLTGPQWVYPWPLWVAGPWGAVLLAISASVITARRATR